jgi:alkyl sulfatase BDS1-like metallo-beta-lactamase superfamily hydrolase
MINTGYTPNEIAEVIELPESLQQDFSNRGYYGTLKHNSKAVYQFYMGWFTANPAALDPLPEEETAKRYIEMMGGIETVVAKAQQQFASVDANDIESISIQYRWLAQLLNQAVFSDPDNQAAKALLAKVYDQLGYLSESGPWRDFYLSGALELRNGNSAAGKELKDIKGLLLAMSVDQFLTKMSVNLNGEKATDKDMAILIRFTDTGDNYQLNLRNSVLRHQKAKSDNNDDFDVTIDVTRELFIDVLTGGAKPRDMIFSDDISVSGSKLDLLSFLQSFDKMDGKFNIVTP